MPCNVQLVFFVCERARLVVLVLNHTENGDLDSLFTHKLLYDGNMSLAAVEQYEIRAFAHRAVFFPDVREPA